MTLEDPKEDDGEFLKQVADYFRRSEYRYLEIPDEQAKKYWDRLMEIARLCSP